MSPLSDHELMRAFSSCPAVNRLLYDSIDAGPISTNGVSMDWEAVWASARDHCLAPYLYRRWTESGFVSFLPPETAERFATATLRNAERNRRLLAILNDLCRELERQGVPVLICKGLPVSHAYYGDLGSRVLYDLDLLVEGHQERRATDILFALGFELFGNERRAADQKLFWRPKVYSWDAESVFDPDQPVFVELHTSVWPLRWHGFELQCNLNLWRGQRFCEIDGVTLRVPSEEHLLVHLAVHYACNALESNARLMHLLDIVLILRLRGEALDWDLIMAEITAGGAEPFCFLAFGLAERTGGAIPRDILRKLRAATPGKIVNWVQSRGLDDAALMNLRHRDRSLIYFLHWNMARNWPEKGRVLHHSLHEPWAESEGSGRWKSLVIRLWQRLCHLRCASSARWNVCKTPR